MNLEAVADELATALKTMGLRVPPWGVERITPPAAIIALPERIDYDGTYDRGTDRYPDLPVVVLIGKINERSARKQVAAYAAGSGAQSVKQAIEAHVYTSCDVVNVDWAEFDTVRYAGTEYLAAIFHLKITGSGS